MSGKYQFGHGRGENGIFFAGGQPGPFEGFRTAFQP